MAIEERKFERRIPVGALSDMVEEVTDAHLQSAAQAMFRVANEVVAYAKEVTVPIESGVLAGTGQVENPEVSKKGVRVRMTFGGPAAPYALYVHEDPEARHGAEIGKPAGQTWKYLEIPANQSARQLREAIKRAIEEVTG
ncbi:MAG: hypothetical protein R3324_09175 [Halobacteriales archaeon]|nr:hypothetical protein [Halobacteriales archaeon]